MKICAALLMMMPSWVYAAPPSVVEGSLRGTSSVGPAVGLTLSALSIDGAVDRTLLVCVVERAGSARHVTHLTLGPTSLDFVAASEHSQSSGFVRAEVWALPMPVSMTGDLVVSTDFSASLSIAAMTVSGSSGLGRVTTRPNIPPAPPGYSYSSSLARIDAAPDSLLTDCAAVGNNFVATPQAAGQTALWTQIGPDHRLQMSRRVGPGALGWSVNTDTTRWGHVLLEWPSAAAATPGTCDCSSEAFAPAEGTFDAGLVCDGLADDLPPLLAAIRLHGTSTLRRNSIKIPNRACRVTDTVTQRRATASCAIGANNCWVTNVGFFGSGPDSEIRLTDGAPGFGTAAVRPLLLQASFIDPNDPTSFRLNGAGARAFNNQVFDLRLNTGRGNPGAVGIDLAMNNFGRIARSSIDSEDDQGIAGIQATRYGPGPALLDHLSISGFNRCIDLGEFDYGMTAAWIDCTYNVEGIRVTSNALVLRDLTSHGPSPAVRNANVDGLVVLLDSVLTCAESCVGPAIVNAGHLFARDVTCVGFAGGCLSPADGGHLDEIASAGPFSAFTTDARASLRLPIEEPPKARNPASHALRANCATFGADPRDTLDDAEGIRTAISTGRPVIYCPAPLTTGGHGYKIGSPIDLPASVEVLDGLGSSLGPPAGAAPACVFRVAENAAAPLVIRRWWSSGWAAGTPLVCRPAGVTRTVVVEDCAGKLFRFDGSGKVFLVDVAGLLEAHGGADVQADQLDTEEEPGTGAFIVNDASKVSVRGWKTERGRQGTLTIHGGCTEILGGLVYPQEIPTTPLHVVVDASLFAVHAETAYVASAVYPVIVRETRAGVTQDLLASAMPGRGLGVQVFASASYPGCAP